LIGAAALILLTFSLHASYFKTEGTLNVSPGWDSNLDYIYLKDKLLYSVTGEKRSRFSGKTNRWERSDFVLNSGADITFIPSFSERLKFGYLIVSDVYAQNVKYSKTNQNIGVSYNKPFGEEFYLELDFTLNHAMQGFAETLYLAPDFSIDLFYAVNEFSSLFTEIRFSYYHSLHEKIAYLEGPSGGIEAGVYIYPLNDNFSIKTSTGFDIYYFRDERIILDGVLGVSNQYRAIYGYAEAEWGNEKIVFRNALKYAYMRWIKIDKWETWEKRRVDHAFSVFQSIGYIFSDEFEFSFYFSFKKQTSNIGKQYIDYINYTYDKFKLGSSFRYFF